MFYCRNTLTSCWVGWKITCVIKTMSLCSNCSVSHFVFRFMTWSQFANLSFRASAFLFSLTDQLFLNYSRRGWMFNGEPLAIAEAEFLQVRCISWCRILGVYALKKLSFLILVKSTWDVLAVKSCSEYRSLWRLLLSVSWSDEDMLNYLYIQD